MNAQKNQEITEMKNSLDKMIESCAILQAENLNLIKNAHMAQYRYEKMWSSLQSFEDCSIFNSLGTEELSDLENCVSYVLDNIKNIKIRKMIKAG